ncbi:hypothetical protein [Streptomyces sp. B3I8]|uniref:hypothetical protein n=1 Tax=Streptomyces sp. B3I8 TaxID=3042303 RepID=UPI0027D7BDFE|nr:hypothetical protein [Streptomyces sp. B3I8]
MADSKLLVVLDDAHSTAQVRPLIPGGIHSRVLITSLDRLADLQGARAVVLGCMNEDSSLRLLSTIIGRARVDAELAAARQIIRICNGLSLALRIVAIRLLGRPHRPLACMADRLARADRLLDELTVGDLSVRGCFDAGYQALGPAPRHGMASTRRWHYRSLAHSKRASSAPLCWSSGSDAPPSRPRTS